MLNQRNTTVTRQKRYWPQSNQTIPVVQAGKGHYGDISRVDIIAALKAQLGNNATITGFNPDNIKVESGNASLVTYTDDKGNLQLVSDAQGTAKTAVAAATLASYNGDFGKSGVFFLSPQFNQQQMDDLRAGKHLADTTVRVRISGLTVDGKTDQSYFIEIKLNDFTDTTGRVFFGDRPLNDPGYTKFDLSGAVSETSLSTRSDKAAAALDVWRVEQRLKYLAFPAMGTTSNGSKPNVSNNTLQDFKVDGNFATEEMAALKLFEKVVRYNSADASSTAFNNDTNGADGILNTNEADTLNWLNAYNAPHWMQLFAATPNAMPGSKQYAVSNPSLPGWENRQFGTNQTNIELYGTSWMYDLMVAKQFAPDALRQSGSWFNGATDANYGFTPSWNPQAGVQGQHNTHDLGMAFDLGVSNYIDKDNAQLNKKEQLTLDSATLKCTAFIDPATGNINGTLYDHIPDKTAYEAKQWSYDNAVYLTGLLPAIKSGREMNDQVSALRDALSLYAEVRSSTWNANIVSDKNTTEETQIRTALFGDGGKNGALISKILIGSTAANSYLNIHEILQRLGIASGTHLDHQNHFHIYLKPPTWQGLPNNLTADTQAASTTDSTTPSALQDQAQGLLDYANTLITGEELMFTMDVPSIPAQQPPVVLAQAATPAAGAISQPDYILNICKETESTGDPRSAMRAVDPAGMLYIYFQRHGRDINLAAIKTTLLEGTTVGKITAEVDNTGRTSYGYDPTPNYIGNDKAIFLAEFEGKVYKIVLELHVFIGVDESQSTCPPPQLIKVTPAKPAVPAQPGKPAAGTSGFGTGYDLNSVTVTFADLHGAAVGQAAGNTITLDTNAAGNGWFIDPTPGSNEEWLPTSNPNEWVAKAGSAAAGKMDMLSVLLHEYGHALGIEHSAYSGDYMGATLTAGVRRLPSTEELALMQQLAAQAKNALSPNLSSANGGGDAPVFPTLPLGGSLLGLAGLVAGRRNGAGSAAAGKMDMLSVLLHEYKVSVQANARSALRRKT